MSHDKGNTSDFELRDAQHKLVEIVKWEFPREWSLDPEAEAYREKNRVRAVERANKIGALAYERRNENWLEQVHRDFPCRELNDDEVEVTSPIGVFCIRARRVRKGETISEVHPSPGVLAWGRTATHDQTSLPVRIAGRLNVQDGGRRYTFQPSHFVYDDGSASGYLGDYPIEIELRS